MTKVTKQAKKKAKKQTESAVSYLRRLAQDKRLQEELRSAAGGLYGAYSRARAQGSKAVEDKQLYTNLRQAATSIREAAIGLQRPKPKPKRRLQKLGAVALAAGSALLIVKQQKQRSRRGASSGPVNTSATEDNTSEASTESERPPMAGGMQSRDGQPAVRGARPSVDTAR